MEYYIHLLIMLSLYFVLVQSFNLTFGLGRLFNLAHVASYAVGAYVTALMSTGLGWETPACMLLSIVAGGVLAGAIGAISTRLESDYFAIGSMAFSAVVSAVLINWKSVTGGVLGVAGIPRPVLFGFELIENDSFLLFSASISLFVQIVLYILFRNRFARTFRAQSEHEPATKALGCNCAQVRLVAFVIASGCASLAGSLFAYYFNYIDPSSFSLAEMVFIMTIVVVGRPGSFWGALGAAVFLVLLPEALRYAEFSPDVLGPMRQMLCAIIMFLVVAYNREKLFPFQRSV
jgi:branched-chain amino acid transport system permease protein